MLVSGEVAELGEVSSGEGEPVERLRAPCGSTFSGKCGPALGSCLAWASSLKAGLIVISGFWLASSAPAREGGRASLGPPPPPGDLGPDLTVIVRPARDSFSSRNFSCHSRA